MLAAYFLPRLPEGSTFHFLTSSTAYKFGAVSADERAFEIDHRLSMIAERDYVYMQTKCMRVIMLQEVGTVGCHQ